MTPFIQELPRHYGRSPQDTEIQRVLELMVSRAEADKDAALEQLFPSTASGWGLELWEKAYGLKREPGQTEAQRRACILAKIKRAGPSTPELIKSIAQHFSPWPVELAEFPAESRFELWYTGTIGTLEHPEELRAAVNDRKPAHLDWKLGYRETRRAGGYAGLVPREAETFILRQQSRRLPRCTVPVYESVCPRAGETFILRQEG